MKRPKTVLHVLNSAAGGAALSARGLMRTMREMGIASAVVCLDAGTEEEKDALRHATDGRAIFLPLYIWNRKIRADAWKRPILEALQLAQTGAIAGSTARVASFARRVCADLVHSNTILTVEGTTASRLLRIPHVIHLRELLGPGNPFRLPVEGKNLGRVLDRACEAIIANSHHTAGIIRPWLRHGLLHTIANGIQLALFEALPPPRTSGPRVVGMMGSITSRWKKHAVFVEAASLVPRDLDVEFRIYGHDPGSSDPYAAGLRTQIERLGLQDRFVFAGFQDPVEAVGAIDVLAHPAEKESFGRIAVEAMAAARPVVGVNGGAIGEVVTSETGILTKIDDAADMARGIEALLRSPEQMEERGQAGQRRAREHYSQASCTAKVLRVYEEALAARA